jgi:hypothetical protein
VAGWLYDRVAASLAVYDLTVEEYVAEVRAEGENWWKVRDCMGADGLIPFGRVCAPETIKGWMMRAESRQR